MTEVITLTAPGSAARWVGPAAGVAVGLAAASSVCSLLARLRQDPSLALVTERPDVASVLSRITVVGAAMLVAICIYAALTIGRTGDGNDDAAQRRTVLLRYLAPAIATLGAIGLWWRIQDPTTELLDDARTQQAAFDGVDIVGLASISWVCASLSVLVLAAVASVGGPRPGIDRDSDSRERLHIPAIAVLTSLAVGGVSVLILSHPSAHHVSTGAPDAGAGPVNVAGPVAYEIPVDGDADAFLVIGGPGLLRSIGSGSSPDGVEALSGTTGQQVWSLSYPDLWVHGVAASPGTGGVVVVQASYRSQLALIGLDAATGAPLWTRPDSGVLTPDSHTAAQVSSNRFLSVRSIRPSPTSSRQQWEWTVRELRTGDPLWSFTTGSDCAYPPTLTHTYVLTPRCGEAQAIDVLDGQTGESYATLTAADLGGGLTAADRVWASPLPGTDLVVVSSPEFPDTHVRPAALVDTATGTVVRQLPANTDVTVLDSRSLVLTDAQQTEVLVDLDNDTTNETDLSTDKMQYNTRFGSVWARVGDQWVTMTPAPGQVPALAVFSHEEPMKTYPGPCASKNVPTVVSLTDTLLVNCANRIAAVH